MEETNFREYLRQVQINEIKKEVKDVTWKDNIGHFSIDDEKI